MNTELLTPIAFIGLQETACLTNQPTNQQNNQITNQLINYLIN